MIVETVVSFVPIITSCKYPSRTTAMTATGVVVIHHLFLTASSILRTSDFSPTPFSQ